MRSHRTAPPTTHEEHQQRHRELHAALDELLADWILHTTGLPLRRLVQELVEWSFSQTVAPALVPDEGPVR